MKKQLTVLAILILSTLGLKAQQGEILYREFDPPLEIVQNIYGPSQLLELDFDGDGEADHRYYGESTDNLKWHEWELLEVSLNGWETRLVGLDETDPYTFDESDTIIPNAPNGWRNGSDHAYYYYPNLNSNGIYHETYGMRKVIDGNIYYGWYHGYGTEGRQYSGGPYEFRVYIDKIAFCTVPDYPLRYGQTGLTEGIEETTTTTFATIYPNPTNSVLFVETRGRASQSNQTYRITNIMGQTLLQGQITAETQQINIESLPAGLYCITFAGETRKFVVK